MQTSEGSNTYFRADIIKWLYMSLSYFIYQNNLFCLNLRKELVFRILQIYVYGIDMVCLKEKIIRLHM